MSKSKGTRAERELYHLLWDKGFAVVRVAGSGSTPLPAPDLIAGKLGKIYAIECKTIKSNKKYMNEEEINSLNSFSRIFGATPLIGIRFARENWYFLNPDQLLKSKSSMVISKEFAKDKGLSIHQLLE